MEKKHSSSLPTGLIRFSVQRSSPTEIEAIYFKLKDGKVSKSKEIGPNGEAIIDFDKNNHVMGVEMLSPGKVTIKIFNQIKRKYHIPELQNIKIDRLQEALV